MIPVTLDQRVTSGDRPEYPRALVWADDSGVLHARNTGSQSSARLMSFIGANALILISPRNEPYQAGERVEALMFGPVLPAPGVHS
jgi:molybdopterin molybdotransferase